MSLEIFKGKQLKCVFSGPIHVIFVLFLGQMTAPFRFTVLIVSRVQDRQRSFARQVTITSSRPSGEWGVESCSVLSGSDLLGLQLVGESELGSLLLKFGEFVFVFGYLLEGGLDELALHVTD